MIFADWEKWTPQGYYDVSDVLVHHVYERSRKAFAAGDAARDALTTPEQVAERQGYIREKTREGIGGLPSSETPLNARITGVVAGDRFRVEKVIFEARPGQFVTANLYLPDGLTAPTAAVLFVCGHFDRAKQEPEYQIVCQYLMRAGLIVLAQDPIGQGERFSYWEASAGQATVNCGTQEHDHAGAQCLPLGDGLARYFLHDSLRSLDYLASRPEVDAARIGITGNSGGGTQSSLVMLAAGDRLAAAAPTTFIMNRETYQRTGGAQDAEQIWPGFTAAGLDHEDILLAMTPKPVQVQAVTADFFPLEGTRRTVERCHRLWEIYGKSDAFGLVEDASTHHYTRNLARAAAQFFARHLLGVEATIDDDSLVPFPPETLWCTQSGQVRGEIEGAGFIYEENQERLAEMNAARQKVTRPEALAWLRERVYAGRTPGDLFPRFLTDDFGDAPSVGETLAVEIALWRPQEDLMNLGYIFRPKQRAGETLPTIIALWDGGTRNLENHADYLQERCAAGNAVLVLDTSGVGAMTPRSINGGRIEGMYGTLHKLATDLLFLDDDLLSLRTFDVLRALDLLAVWPNLSGEGVSVYASGRQGVAGRLAAALDERIQSVTVADGPVSWAEWVAERHYDTTGIYEVILRGALRRFDLPDLEKTK